MTSEKRLKIIIDLDIKGFKDQISEQGFTPPPDNIAIISLHKCRVRHTKVPENLKEESKQWLIKAGCKRW